MRTTLKHPFHKHTLILRELSKDFDYSCHLCVSSELHRGRGPYSGKTYRAVYCCEDCDFFVHKLCAESPQRIQHPSHPQHPLILDYDGFVYRCREPKCPSYQVDAQSAIATLPPEDDEENNHDPQVLHHFAHDHPLTFFHMTIPSKIECIVCTEEILGGPVYGCRACLFLIHESCAQLPQEIQHHPLHPQHTLNLVFTVSESEGQRLRLFYISCQICDDYDYMEKPKYLCHECGFVLHVNCAITSISPPPLDRPVKLDSSFHEHQLTCCYLKGGQDNKIMYCQVCQLLIKSGQVMYCCTTRKPSPEFRRSSTRNRYRGWGRFGLARGGRPGGFGGDDTQGEEFCGFNVHAACAELSKEIVHPYHPNHPLNLIPGYGRGECHACGTYCSNKDYVFGCGTCDFNIDVGCALQTLSAILEEGASSTLQHFAHPDLLFTLCYIEDHCQSIYCKACKKCIIEGLAYFCREKDEHLHRWCANQLKPILKHPLHPKHPLVLLHPLEKERMFCKGCHETSSGDDYYYYSCSCGFNLDLKCALQGKQTLKDSCHQHDLAYLEKAKFLRCNACGYSCGTDLYRCVECNFSIHNDCLPLLSVLEHHECHHHPLLLRDKLVAEGDQDYDKQGSCDVCKGKRNPRHGVYYCEECRFASHIECVISKEPKSVKPKHSHSLRKEIKLGKRRLEDKQKELQKLMKNLQFQMKSVEALEKVEDSTWKQTPKKSTKAEEDSDGVSSWSSASRTDDED